MMTAALVAFSFGSPGILGFLVVAAVPWILHLLSRRRHDDMPWAAMGPLLEALRDTQRRIRLENWLLLALRTLLIVLIVLAAADPQTISEERPGSRTAPIHHILVFDASYSMQLETDGTTVFARAKAAARRVLDGAVEGDSVSIVIMSESPRVVLALGDAERDEPLRRIDDLRCEDTMIRVAETCRRVELLIDEADQVLHGAVRHRAYFVTDMQRVGWTDVSQAEQGAIRPSPSVQAAMRRLAGRAALVLIEADSGEQIPPPENIAVADLRLAQPIATENTLLTFEAELRLYGGTRRTALPVELHADGRLVQRDFVDIGPNGTAIATFSHAFTSVGRHVVELRTAGDVLPVDDTRRLVVDVRPALKLLVVSPTLGSAPSMQDGTAGASGGGLPDFYLCKAILPGRSLSGEGIHGAQVAIDRQPDGRLGAIRLSDFDGILFTDVPRFTEDERKRLDAFLAHGGGLVFFLGPRVDRANYNAVLAPPSVKMNEDDDRGPISAAILPVRLGGIADNTDELVDPIAYRHPIVGPFRGNPRSGLLSTPIQRYCRVEGEIPNNARVVLRLEGGDPLIIEHAVGDGRGVLVMTSADLAWSPAPLWPSYVPLVHELIAYAVGNRFEGRNRLAGQPLTGVAPSAWGNGSATVMRPDGRRTSISLVRHGTQRVFRYEPTFFAGIYRLGPQSAEDMIEGAVAETPADDELLFAVNAWTPEGDPTCMSFDEFQANVVREITPLRGDFSDGQSATTATTSTGRLPFWLLVAAVCAAAAEFLLARWFGRGRADSTEQRQASRTAARETSEGSRA